MPYRSAATCRANQATADRLGLSVLPTHTIADKNISFTVKATSDLCDVEHDQIWHIFEENMCELYRSSSFGWDPQEKRKEIFDPLSRFVFARDNPLGSDIIAYSIFRFDTEDRQSVVYCYELQISKDVRRLGLGRLLTQILADIGAQWGMTKVMLTVFKANHAAMQFYESIGFTIDEVSPDFLEGSEDGTEDQYDYSILSKCIS